MSSWWVRAVGGVVMLVVVLPACASRKVAPIGAEGQPFRPEADERALWAQAAQEEQGLLKRAKRYDDPQLEEYLRDVAQRLVPEPAREAGAPAITVMVIRDPTLNAFAMPNGTIYVHTGLLSRLENEAQLATILSHEVAHITHRHALKVAREAHDNSRRDAGTVAASIGVAVAGSPAKSDEQVGTAVLSQTANTVLGLGLGLATVAAIQGYGRDLEREADEQGMAQLARAGYDPAEVPRALTRLLGDASDRGAVETFFLGSRPRLQERIATTSALIRTKYVATAHDAQRIRRPGEFEVRVRTVVRENAYEDIRMGRFALAGRQLDRVLEATPGDPLAHVYYGDLHRLRAQRAPGLDARKGEARRALEYYERAAELDAALADPWRQLGFLHYQQNDKERAKAAFEKYLTLKPAAADGPRIKEYLLELDR